VKSVFDSTRSESSATKNNFLGALLKSAEEKAAVITQTRGHARRRCDQRDKFDKIRSNRA
jgi:hypothetical protein